MRLPETELTLADVQDEVVSLAEDIVELDNNMIEIDKAIDGCLDAERQICENCIEMCGFIDDANKGIAFEHKRINNIFEMFDTYRIILFIVWIFLLVWCWVLTYLVCHGL